MDSKSKFISEKTIEENKRKRAEEWEKARAENKDLPELKEQEYDPRTLFERLQEQKTMKEEAQKEASKLSNLIHTVNDDEAAFLYSLKEKSLQKEKKIELDDLEQLKAFKETLIQRTQLTEPTLPKIVSDNKQVNWNFTNNKRSSDSIGSSLGIVKKSKVKEDEVKEKSSSSPPKSLGLVAYSDDEDDSENENDEDNESSGSLID
ncbi:hypothetical protein CONCODRAFT_84067 [Conidiobolus coronatus NRRL 28638]|uniref:FAM192A/Fyv6 N-terminal domain-containing protein n=1 Tax=Conidiobolus coronatus (strain ATCC 28846 / CBS 209.66 / NRRL 28638) TaxID=796925 RepID=A0A137PBX9_CONC2|nr:hypothetical protein CONCODRAFT_84067 [Conidiobolus coronatus NRRL 28638]|eukprot:KXN72441.1 hypothetical protein CONCODRAFT_84067 [Conidiobolus coronatus NRRL 28638]